jgi:hypothetical protein
MVKPWQDGQELVACERAGLKGMSYQIRKVTWFIDRSLSASGSD